MADPFTIEKRFQTLRQTLTLIASPRMRLHRMMEFVYSVGAGDYRVFLPAYVPELLASFWPTACTCDFTGTPLVFVRELIRFSEMLSAEFSDVGQGDEWSAVLQHLKKEEKRIALWLEERKSSSQTDLPVAEEAGYDAVWIPVVETETLADVGPNRFGTVRRLHVRTIPKAGKSGKDELLISKLTGVGGQTLESLSPAVAAAKSLVKLCVGERGNTQLIVQGWFDGPHSVAGESIQAGLALVLFTEQLHMHGHRDQYTLNEDTAITGSIDSSGKLLPVDPEGLRSKIEACTFSWIRHVVVPEEQVELARFFAQDAVSLLGAQPVEIVGVRSIDDVLANRRLTGLQRVTGPTRAARQIWKWRARIAALLILLLIAVLAKIWYGPMDREPADARFENNELVVKNAHGEVLASFSAGNDKDRQAYWRVVAPVLYDVDGDGEKEVMYGLVSSGGLSALRCRSVFGDRIIWNIQLKRRVVFPKISGTEQENFKLRGILAGDFDKDGKKEVLCLLVHDLFPCLLLKLDGSTGRELSAYLHVGHLASPYAVDLDGDNREEIVLIGVNNALRNACLVVLDPGHIEGHSILTPKYMVEGWTPAGHRAYLRIPKTVVAEALRDAVKWNLATTLVISESSKTLRVSVEDQTTVAGYSATVYLDLDFNLRPLEFGTGDVYDVTAEKLLREGRIRRLPDKKYFDALRYKVMCWDGTKWRSAMAGVNGSNLMTQMNTDKSERMDTDKE